MIPQFPAFKAVTREDIPEIKTFNQPHLPYNEFNPANLIAWDPSVPVSMCLLNQNLVISLIDSLTEDRVFSFLGGVAPLATVSALMDYTKSNAEDRIDYLPFHSIESEWDLVCERFHVSPNRSYFDYIYDTSEWSTLSGRKFKDKRQQANKFIRNYEAHSIIFCSLQEKKYHPDIFDLFARWEDQVVDEDYLETDVAEIEVLRALIDLADVIDLHCVMIYVGGMLVSFTLNQVIQKGYFLAHFGKSDRRYPGLASYSEMITAKNMEQMGCGKINYEEDLGIDGLRAYKQSWKPTGFLEKYSVRFLPGE